MSIEKPRPAPPCPALQFAPGVSDTRRRRLRHAGAVRAAGAGRAARRATAEINPLAPKPPNFPAKAKHVIYLFMHGGPSHLDTFDPKPLLEKLNGQKLPESLRNVRLQFTDAADAPLLASQRKFQRIRPVRDRSLRPVSRTSPDTSTIWPLIRSCHHEAFVHGMALNLMNTGSSRMGFPEHGLVDRLRAGQRKPEPAGVHGDAGGRHQGRSAGSAPAFFRPRIRARSCAIRAIRF